MSTTVNVESGLGDLKLVAVEVQGRKMGVPRMIV